MIFMIAALSGNVSAEKGDAVTITENLLVGEWEGNNIAGAKITARFEIVVFLSNVLYSNL